MSSGRKRNVSIDSEKNSPTAGDQFPKKAGERLPRAAKKKRLSLTAVVTDQTEAEKSGEQKRKYAINTFALDILKYI